jgi:translation initiation factor 1
MAKKARPDVSVGEPKKLTHNPFASLCGGSAGSAGPAPVSAAPAAAAPARSGRLVLARETKHRGGKAVVIVRGFAQLRGWDEGAVSELARELKQSLGCGGTVEAGCEIVVQGDRPAQVAEWLRVQGFRVEGVTG